MARAVLNRMLFVRSLNRLATSVNRHSTKRVMRRVSSILLSRSLDLRPLYTTHAESAHYRAIGAQQAQHVGILLYVVAIGQHERDTYPQRSRTIAR